MVFHLFLLLLLLPQFSYSSDSSVSLNSSAKVNQLWYNRLYYSMYSWLQPTNNWYYSDCDIRPILLSTYKNTSSSFVFGFVYNRSANAIKDGFCFFLVIALLPGDNVNDLVVLWSANRDNPVRENATLHFTADSGLELKDVDGTLVWSTNTSALPVTQLNISDGANLMLLDSKDKVIWQSFDYPTDTWLPNQSISPNKGLTSSNSSSNLGTGMYSLSVEGEDPYNSLVAFINSDPPQIYMSLPVDYLNNYFKYYGSIEGFSNNVLFRFNRTVHRFLYIRLEPNGHLNLYQIPNDSQTVASFNLFERVSESDCDYPTACGNYGVCSQNGLCSCPGGNYSYFTQLQVLQPNQGCRPVTPLSCKDKHLHTFLELNRVAYFNLEPYHSNMDRDSCKKACLDNCTCKAAFFSPEGCSLQSQLYSLKSNSNNDSVAFIKVQKQALKDKRKLSLVAVLVSTLSVGLVIILVVVSCYYYNMRIKWNKEEEEEEGDDQVIGALKRFPFL
ncbi:hypothetical protein LguiA_007869 [Lonicera macranthoides]